jgi:D-alanyl-lipoteichoic acid acyltransferase DltB (MBOAT superfamily)
MLFNSIDFAVFLPIVFLLYWFLLNRNIRLRNLLIVVASYIFYGWWNWRFLSLIILSTMVDYSVGYRLSKVNNSIGRKALLWISIMVNIGFLGFFKYYNFFLDNFVAVFSFFGRDLSSHSLNIILPVGISFYTFQTLSYTIDVYRHKLEPTSDFIAFSAFVAFFPQLVAGPIERAKHLLPQFYTLRAFDYNKSVDGMRQILWGLFKKVVIADSCAEFANYIFNNSAYLNGSTLVLGALFFSFQIYGDFSGYSDIAIGTAKLFGFDLMRNFNFPYFSRDIAEFWRRWHISLSTWFRDYLYIPLGGSRGSVLIQIRNTFIIFIVSGFWHGANWTFIVWGALNAVYFLPLLLTKNNRRNLDIPAMGRTFPTLKELALMLLTFGLTVFAWIFFRAEDLGHALGYIQGIFSVSLFEMPDYKGMRRSLFTIFLIVVFVLTEWHGREEQFAIANFLRDRKRAYRWSYYMTLIFLIFWLHNDDQTFIYFQF